MYAANDISVEAEVAYRREQLLKSRSPKRVWRRRGQRTPRPRPLPQRGSSAWVA